MRRGRDQAHVPLPLAAARMPRPDRQQPGILPLRPGVRLHREGVVAGDRAELAAEIADHLLISLGLVRRHERMDVGELRPAQRHHLRRRVQLHRAGPERDHRPVERQIPVGQPPHVAGDLRLGPVHVEDRMRQVRRWSGRSPSGSRYSWSRSRSSMSPPNARQTAWVCSRRVRSSSEMPIRSVADLAEVDPLGHRRLQDHPLQRPDLDRDRVEEGLRLHLEPEALQPLRQPHRLAVDPLRDRPQPLRPMEHRIHRRHHRQQRLRRADVRRRLLPPDMLLARLQAQPVRPVAARVDRDPDDPPRHRPLQRVPDRHVGRMRPAEPQRHPEALRRAHRDVRPHLPRRLQQRQRQRIRRDAGQRARPVQRRDRPGEIVAVRHRSPDTGRSPRRPPPAPGRRRGRRRPPPSRTAPPACGSRRSSADGSPGRRRRPAPSTSPPAGRAPSPPPPPSPRRAATRSPRRARSGRRPWSGSSAAPPAAPG